MPKQKITKEMVVEAAFSLAREGGMEQVLVKNIADKLGCSVQPIYSYCQSMEGLRKAVAERTDAFVRQYADARLDADDLFRSTGRAYLQLAKEEPNLFKIFTLHRREGISSLEGFYRSEASPQTAGALAQNLNLTLDQARQLHIHMLVYTIGIGTIFSVTSPGIPAEDIYSLQETAYQAFLNQIQATKGEQKDGT